MIGWIILGVYAVTYVIAWRAILRHTIAEDRRTFGHRVDGEMLALAFAMATITALFGPAIVLYLAAKSTIGKGDGTKLAARLAGETKADKIARLEYEAEAKERRIHELERSTGIGSDLMASETDHEPHGTQCTATAKSTGRRCTRPAVDGATVCRFHGGAAPQVQKAAQVNLMRREAARFAPDLERDEDPAEVLLSELRRSRALAAYWEDQLATGQLWVVGDGIGGSKTLSVEGELWQRERDRAISIAATCIKLGLEERRVRIAEGVGDAMFAALEASLLAVGIALDTDTGRAAFEAGAAGFEKALGPGDEG